MNETAECDRCGDEIHVLAPKTSIKFSGSVDSQTLVVCQDCYEPLLEWWDNGDAT